MKTNRSFARSTILGSAVILALAGLVGAAIIKPGFDVGPEFVAVAFGTATVFCLLALARVGRVRPLPARSLIVARPVTLRSAPVRRPVAARRLEQEQLAA